MSAQRIEVPDVQTLRRRHGRKWSRYPSDVLPAWIADMDLLQAPVIRTALETAIADGDLGYGPTAESSGVPESFAAWAQRRWSWSLDPSAVLLMPDVVVGIANCIEALTLAGDAILVQTPVYPPFLSNVTRSRRRLVTCDIVDDAVDFDAIERTIVEQCVQVWLLCHPHNPMGRCFTRDELVRIAAIAAAHHVIIVSDEVHADLVYPPLQHIPLATVSSDAAARTITLNSASKAFNVAGLRCAVCIAQHPGLRQRLAALPAQRWTPFGALGVRATLAAWSDAGEYWLSGCVEHLMQQRDRLASWLAWKALPVRCVPPQASYLAWIDCRDLELLCEPDEFFLQHARVALSPGYEFGAAGRGHARLNFATSAGILDQILERMTDAYRRRNRSSQAM